MNELLCLTQEVGKRGASEKAQGVPIRLRAAQLRQPRPRSSEAHEFGLDPVILSQSVSLHLTGLVIIPPEGGMNNITRNRGHPVAISVY